MKFDLITKDPNSKARAGKITTAKTLKPRKELSKKSQATPARHEAKSVQVSADPTSPKALPNLQR